MRGLRSIPEEAFSVAKCMKDPGAQKHFSVMESEVEFSSEMGEVGRTPEGGRILCYEEFDFILLHAGDTVETRFNSCLQEAYI